MTFPVAELYENRPKLRSARRIANPGCYATSMQMLLAPLLSVLDSSRPPAVFGLSGYSGAGTVSASDPDGRPVTLPKVTPEDLSHGVRPYALTDHIHEREAAYHLGPAVDGMGFVPAVGSWFSGITSVASVPLARKMSAADVRALYEAKYAGEPLVELRKEAPSLKEIENRHGWVFGGVQVHSGGRRAVVVVRCEQTCDVLGLTASSFCRVAWTICSKALRLNASRWVSRRYAWNWED